ncbi:hypothetical protein V8D89_004144 [Ganoderma adspersum]
MRLAAPDHIPNHDGALVTLFVSEELDGGSSIFRVGSASAGVLRTNALLERYFIHLNAFKWLGGRYCHCASIFDLEKRHIA